MGQVEHISGRKFAKFCSHSDAPAKIYDTATSPIPQLSPNFSNPITKD